jgi:cbb3-type cytochrome oxidase maturation protein
VEILYLLIPMGVVLMAIAIGVLFWAIRSGQYEDLEGPAYRILMDDDERPPPDGRGDRKES